MPKSRKTRRFEPQKKAENIAPVAATPTATTPRTPAAPPASRSSAPGKVKSIAERYPYVGAELKRIAWLTIAVMAILVILFFVIR